MAKSQEDRRELGQFATPTVLAREIVTYGLQLLPPEETIRFLDPAIGTGSFFSALLEVADQRRIACADGYEIDPHYGLPSQIFWQDTLLHIRMHDFTTAEPPDDKYNFLICNPPYVRHHLLNSDNKFWLQQQGENLTGIRMSGLSGLYCYFMLLSEQWLADDGVAGWLVPSEFLDVNYGKGLKDFLLQRVSLLQIHRFDPREIQFDDALVSSVIVWFRKRRPAPGHLVHFTYGGSLSKPLVESLVPVEVLEGEPKWTRFPNKGSREHDDETPCLSDFFKIKRGIATGKNSFFIKTQEEIERLDLPMECFRPVLPSSRYVLQDEICADKNGYPLVSPLLFLLDCRLPEEEIQERYPTLWRYLENGKEAVAGGYLCGSRKKWYYQEERDSSPFLCTYMGRSKSRNPIRFLLNHSKAVATNSYLVLYPHPHVTNILLARPELIRRTWQILRNIDIETLLSEGRVYGGGLHKIEPKELSKVQVPELGDLLV